VKAIFDAGLGKAHKLNVGVVESIPYFAKQERLTFARCGTVDPQSLESYRAAGGYRGLERALTLGSKAIVEEVVASGLRGRGGAGFPTGIKWRTAADPEAAQKYIVCNADEGDSGTFADRMIMEGDPFVLIEGLTIAGIAVGATKGFIYARSEYPHAIAALELALDAARKGGVLGVGVAGSAHSFDIEVRVGAGAYVCGEETSLLESIEGKRGVVRAKPPLPAHKGLFGRPTVINNVLSLASVPVILERGAAFYRDLGWAAPAGRCPSNLQAASSMAACSKPDSALRSVSSSTTSAEAPQAAAPCAPCRSAGRSALTFPAPCSTRRSIMKRSRLATA
jgi:formate dehydrogenase iron-sulfur subunit